MPIYEYKCRKCGSRFEKLVPRAGTPVVCDACGSDEVEKQFSLFSAVVSNPASQSCAHRESCSESSDHCGCGCGCGCGGHHHH